jgi:hypothetical protein
MGIIDTEMMEETVDAAMLLKKADQVLIQRKATSIHTDLAQQTARPQLLQLRHDLWPR